MFEEKIDFYSPTSLKSYNLEETVRYQLSMLGNLDVVTRKHSENVANLTCRLCEQLKCSQKFTIHCTVSAYLHDLGKLFIPSKVLQKPGKLTDEEYSIMKSHTTLGYNACMKDLKLRPYAQGVLNHHEALDGTGYPNGLTKKQIPYEAQIIRIADEFDALVSKRQYKTHISISDTLKLLIEETKSKTSSLKVGKINPLILKKLFKVVIEDISYEIYGITSYIDYLKGEIKRLELIDKYNNKAEASKKEKTKNYYLEGMNMLFREGENIDNYKQIIQDYKNTLNIKLKTIDDLHNETKIIKKLKV